jgi:hypothetical protein
MSTVIFRIPSKVQYGYVEIQATPEELGGDASLLSSPELLAEMYVRYTKDFRGREEQALKAAAPAPKPKAEKPVSIAAIVDDITEAEKLLKDGLGATVVGDKVTVAGMEFTKHSESPFEEAPYKKTPPAAKAKPWEEKGAVKAPDLGDLFA